MSSELARLIIQKYLKNFINDINIIFKIKNLYENINILFFVFK